MKKKKSKKEAVEEEDEEEDEKNDEDGEETDSNTTTTCENLVDSSLPPVDRTQQRIAELQKMKANCKSKDLEQSKTRCEVLVRNCIVGLLAQLSDEDFKNMEDELNRAVCWYLTCERYWEDLGSCVRTGHGVIVGRLLLLLHHLDIIRLRRSFNFPNCRPESVTSQSDPSSFGTV